MHNDTKNQFDVVAYRDTPLRLGQVDFINCFPINLPIELGKVKINAETINNVPSELNKMILDGEIDIAPVSSLTYIENKDKLVPVADLCIASNGPADSVLLFSKYPIEELDRAKIALSHASVTSNKLLEIILNNFLKLNCRFRSISSEPQAQNSNYSAWLLIGDHALLEYSKAPRDIFVYDLGSLWKKYTDLPMTFGIWVIRKEVVGAGHDLPLIANKLKQALSIGLGPMLDTVIKKAQERILNSKEFYKSYFEHLSYELTDNCKKGLSIFEEYCKRPSIFITKESASPNMV